MIVTSVEELTGMNAMIKQRGRRGINVLSLSELMSAQARGKDGEMHSVQYDQPLFGLSPSEKSDIFRLCTPIWGIVTSRMNRISGLEWQVIPEKKDEDKIAQELKNYRAIYKEYSGIDEIKYVVMRAKLANEIRKTLPDVMPDLSNFDRALVRWKNRINSERADRAGEIMDWLMQPNANHMWEDFVKIWVNDLLVQGNSAIYIEVEDNRPENLYIMPSGTVMPIKTQAVGAYGAYFQYVPGFEPQLFFKDELSYSIYCPMSTREYGICPIDALVNKVAETLMFDKLMAEQADGTKLPEKLIIFGEESVFGSGLDDDSSMPVNKNEQKRVETVINEARKGAIRTLTGIGKPLVLDVSRSDTMQTQIERQRQIREEVALVYNMSNMEVNLSGSEDTSGRATSESQERIELGKGIAPIISLLQTRINFDILPRRYGHGYRLRASLEEDMMAKVQLWTAMKQSGLYSTNEIRVNEMSDDPFEGEEFDKPEGSQAQQQGQGNPLAGMMG